MKTECVLPKKGRIFMVSRKDSKGRKLKEGESERKDGRYSYRYTDSRSGKRKTVYAKDLIELREKELAVKKDLENNLMTGAAIKKMTLNSLFETYLETRKITDSSKLAYRTVWDCRVKNSLGNYRVVQIRTSDIKAYYNKLSNDGYSHSSIKLVHSLIYPTLELAVNDDIILKNPVKGAWGDYGKERVEKKALTLSQEKLLLSFVKSNNIYNLYYPMLVIMLGTGVRCGELLGLTWNDVNMEERKVTINQQLLYKDYGDGYKFHVSKPKTSSSTRTIPMTQEVYQAFQEQWQLHLIQEKQNKIVEVDGYKDFIFTTKTGKPFMPCFINTTLYHIVDTYNQEKQEQAEVFPKISAHTMRHTACTRMAEKGMDIKVLQYIMGHANITVTIQVYNHIADITRVEKEIAKMDSWVASEGNQKK